MSAITLQQSPQGWIVALPQDFTAALGVPEGSLAVLYARNGTIETEILPPPTQNLKDISKRIAAKHRNAFEEMQRLGD